MSRASCSSSATSPGDRAAQMQAALTGAEFGGQPLSGMTTRKLVTAGQALLAQADALAAG